MLVPLITGFEAKLGQLGNTGTEIDCLFYCRREEMMTNRSSEVTQRKNKPKTPSEKKKGKFYGSNFAVKAPPKMTAENNEAHIKWEENPKLVNRHSSKSISTGLQISSFINVITQVLTFFCVGCTRYTFVAWAQNGGNLQLL